MGTSTILTITGIIATIIFGGWSIYLARSKMRYASLVIIILLLFFNLPIIEGGEAGTIEKIMSDHPIFSIIGVTSPICVGLFFCFMFFYKQRFNALSDRLKAEYTEKCNQKDREIASLKERFRSIELRMGEEKGFLDISTVWLKDLGVAPPSSAEYGIVDDCYTFKKEKLPSDWEYEKTSELKLLSKITNQSPNFCKKEYLNVRRKVSKYQEMPKLDLTDIPVYLCRKKENQWHNIQKKSFFSFICVEKIQSNLFQTLIPTIIHEEPKAKGIVEKLERIYKKDVLGTWLTFQLSQVFVIGVITEIHTKLISVQRGKEGDILELNLLSTFEGVAVDGEQREKYYLIWRSLFFNDGDDLYILRIMVPSLDPGCNEDFTFIDAWLKEFRIRKKT